MLSAAQATSVHHRSPANARTPCAQPIGEHQALLLRREPLHPHDQTLELWFAPALGYLPVRLTISQANGDRLDQLLANIEKP